MRIASFSLLLVALLSPASSAAIVVNTTFVGEGIASPFFQSRGGPGGAAPSSTTGSGDIQSLVNAAVLSWQSLLIGDRTLSLAYTWQDRSGLGETLTASASGSPPFDAYIRFDNSINWFMDATPNDHSEFGAYTETSLDLGGGEVNIGRNFAASDTGPAAGQFDFYTVALHEVGHALGFVRSGPGFSDPLVIRDDLPFSGSTLGTFPAGGGHINDGRLQLALLDPDYDGPGTRALISDIDALALAQITGDSVSITAIPEPASFAVVACVSLVAVMRRGRKLSGQH